MAELTQEEIKDRIEHRDMLLDIQAILVTKSGKNFFKYLFKYLDVSELPPLGLTGDMLMDKLGSLRAGNSVFKLVAEASPDIAGQLIAQNERDKNAQIYEEYANGSD